jgi:hypothetical protein
MQWWTVGEEVVACDYMRAENGSGAKRIGIQSAAW